MNSIAATNDRRILIIDDNPAIHDDFKKILEAASDDSGLDDLSAFMFDRPQAEDNVPRFELTSAYQGQQGLELVRQSVEQHTPFAMAFVDMRMPPGWDGLQTIEEVWKVDPRLEIVICTAYSDYSWSEIIQRVAFRDRLLILKKPFDNIEVCQLAIALTQKWELERNAELRMYSIVETAADGIITFREDGIIESSNGACAELFGWKRGALIGSSFARLLADSQQTSWKEWLHSIPSMENNVRIQARDMVGRRKDGSLVPLLVSISEFPAEGGRRFTVILRDLTEYKQLQANLAQAQKLESIGQLAAGISHEINTPMQYIGQNIEYLGRCLENLRNVIDAYEQNLMPDGTAKSWQSRLEELDKVMRENRFDMVRDELPKAVEESLEGVERVVSIVRAMREFSHPGQKEKSKIDLNRAINSAVTITRNRWKYSSEIELDLEPDLPCVPGIAAEINQTLLNLVVNAADTIAEKLGDGSDQLGTITLRTIRERDHAVIKVEDDGCGIPSEIQKRVFDPFFTTKEVGKGTGQGLAICYNVVVNNHNGTIDVESTPGKGSIFTIRLPWVPISATASDDRDMVAVGETGYQDGRVTLDSENLAHNFANSATECG